MMPYSAASDPFGDGRGGAGLGREMAWVLSLAGLFAIALLMIATTIYFASIRQDRTERINEERVVRASLDILARSLSGNVEDYANWDDAVRYLALQFDPTWARRNVGQSLAGTLGYDIGLVVDANDRPLFGQIDGIENTAGATKSLSGSLAQFVEKARSTDPRLGRPVVGTVIDGAISLMVAAAAIVPEPGSTLTRPPGQPFVLLFAKHLDQAYLTGLQTDFGLAPLRITDAAPPKSPLASVELTGPTGQVTGHIVWYPRQPGRDQLIWALPALMGGLLTVIIFTSLALHGVRLTRDLRANETRLRDFADASPDWWWETDSEHRFAWISPNFARLSGTKPERVLGRTRQEIAGTGTDGPAWIEFANRLADRRPFRDFTYMIRAGESQIRAFRTSGSPIFDRDGHFNGYRGVGRDITEEWEAGQRLRESEQRFRSLVENLHGIIFCHGIAGDGPHGYDEQGAQIYGADAAALAGTVDERQRAQIGTWYAAIHEADRPAYLAAETGRKEHGRPYTIEYRIRHPATGQERWMREVAWVVEAPEDARRYLDSYIIDVTDEKLAALALQDSELRLQLALSAGDMGTWDLDLRTGEERWNDVHYRLFGVDPKTFIPSSESFQALVDPRDREDIQALGDDVIAGRIGPSFTNDYRIVLPNAEIRWIGGGGRLIRDEQGNAIRLLGVSFDITERKERESALQQAHAQLAEQASLLAERNRELEAANLAKDRFVASVSHEIRTPMNAVLGFADLLGASDLSEAQERYVDVIRATGKQLLTLLNDILDMAKIEAERLDLEEIDFRLAACLEQVRSLLAPQASERNLDLLVANDTPADLVLRGDPTRLSQVLVNLVGNGIKFTSQGSVTLRVLQQSADYDEVKLRFEILDTGIGIATERRTDLFRPFVQADSSITRNYGGTGLGLAICRSLVEAMGGTIGVESMLGAGSLFWFEVPFRRGVPAARPDASSGSPAGASRLRILVADDVASNRELLGEVLSKHGHEMLFAEDGAAALAIARSERLDLILMDVQMPVMHGIEATKRIRQLPPPHGSVAIYALTAHAMAAERARCLAAGMNLCLTKPIVWPDLFAALAPIASGSLSVPAPARAAPVPTAAPTQAVLEVPLLDHASLHELKANIPAGHLQGLVGRAVTGMEEACARMSARDRAQLAEEAHRLRGTAGSFGFSRVSALAGLIEELASAGHDAEQLILELKAAARETRAALEESTIADTLA